MIVAAAVANSRVKVSKLPKSRSICSASPPVGFGAPRGMRFCQNSECGVAGEEPNHGSQPKAGSNRAPAITESAPPTRTTGITTEEVLRFGDDVVALRDLSRTGPTGPG